MTLRIVEVETLPAVAWRNGLGTARTLAVSPPEAPDGAASGLGSDAFDWRVGIAEIDPGRVAFSRYAGVDRVLVATGPGLSLGLAGDRGAKRPVEPWIPMAFDGDVALEATLLGVRLRVFNVMARRGAAAGVATVHRRSTALPPDATTVLWCVRGRARIGTADGATAALAAGSAMVVAQPAAHLHVENAETVVLAATLRV